MRVLPIPVVLKYAGQSTPARTRDAARRQLRCLAASPRLAWLHWLQALVLCRFFGLLALGPALGLDFGLGLALGLGFGCAHSAFLRRRFTKQLIIVVEPLVFTICFNWLPFLVFFFVLLGLFFL